MMNIRPAVTSEAKPLIGLYATSGAGKTMGALLVAKGYVGDMSKVVMLETESGRGEALASHPEVGGYQVVSLREDFSPKTFGQGIAAAEKFGAKCLIVDSASLEWTGIGGVLDMASKNQEAGKKGVLVWQQPKILHAREFILRLLQTPIPLVILCMRARYPMEEKKSASGAKEWTRSTVLDPIQADDILFEMFIHGWIDQEHVFHGTKYTLDQLKDTLRTGEKLSADSGRRLAEWAAGGKKDEPKGDFITVDQALAIEARCNDNGIQIARLKKAAGVDRISLILAANLDRANGWLDKVIADKGAE